MVNGVVSVVGAATVYSNNDTGMNTVDIVVTASGGEIVITMTGIVATIIHTVHMTKLSSLIKQ